MIHYHHFDSTENDERESANQHSVLLTDTRTFPIQMRSSYTAVGVIVTLSITIEEDARGVKLGWSRIISDGIDVR